MGIKGHAPFHSFILLCCNRTEVEESNFDLSLSAKCDVVLVVAVAASAEVLLMKRQHKTLFLLKWFLNPPQNRVSFLSYLFYLFTIRFFLVLFWIDLKCVFVSIWLSFLSSFRLVSLLWVFVWLPIKKANYNDLNHGLSQWFNFDVCLLFPSLMLVWFDFWFLCRFKWIH